MTPNFSGIYEIRCTATDKAYVGSAVWIAKRWRHHRDSLRKGAHHSQKLQRAWDKYGEAVFVFSVLCACKPELLLIEEQKFIDLHRAADRELGYNVLAFAGSRLGFKMSEEQKRRISERKTGIKLSPAHRASLSNSLRGNKRALGSKHSPETLLKVSAASKRSYAKNAANLVYKKTPEQRAEVGERFRGKPLAEAHREKIAASRMGHVNTPEQLAKFAKSRRVLSDEQLALMRELHSAGVMQVTIAARFGCSKQTICNALRGRGYGV